ncbi:MAG: energy transducer TonB [Gammaproteobacteria bacterium]|nr:energy transducer TonB [Gammaproteobacteria bacterium]
MNRRSCSRQRGVLATGFILVSLAVIAQEQDLTPRLSHVTDDDTDRVPMVTAFPDYPSIARRDRIEGEATVCFRIDTRGKVLSPRVRESSHRIFVKPTLRAIRASSFEPLRPGQTLKGSKTCRTYRYRLESLPSNPDVLGVEQPE